mgnify:CR=1 FL=1
MGSASFNAAVAAFAGEAAPEASVQMHIKGAKKAAKPKKKAAPRGRKTGSRTKKK